MTQQIAQLAFHRPRPDAAALGDARLVAGVRAGDPAGFEMIMRRYNRRLYRLARGILRNESGAEDVVQDSYVRSYKELDDPMTGFEGSVAPLPIETVMAPQSDPEKLAASGELRRLIGNAIDTLPDAFRTVFVLRAVEGLTVCETAQYLSNLPATVKARFHRARRLLQGALSAQLDPLMPSTFAFAGQRCRQIVAPVLGRPDHSFEPTRRAEAFSRPPSAIASVISVLSPISGDAQIR